MSDRGAALLEDGRLRPGLRVPPPRSLYLHVPFCPHRCHYCDYPARGSARPPLAAWREAVLEELRARCRRRDWPARPPLETIYVGGGTPSLLGGEGIEALADGLRDRFRWDPAEVEWTVEANPESLDPETARRWREAGVTRVTVGVQSFRETALDWLGRLHDPEAAERALAAARAAGVRTVDADLMYGLPEEAGGAGAASDAGRLAEAGVDHVSLYGLEAGEGTALGRWVEAGAVSLPDEEREGRAYLEISRRLRNAGYEHYETSHLARPGHRSRHNRAYWEGTPYLGAGPAAHSFLPPVRLRNEHRWSAYRNAVREQGGAAGGAERRDDDDRRLERIWLRLRQRTGLAGGDPLLDELESEAGGELRSWEERGWVRRDDDGLQATPEGWLHLDDLISTLAARLES